MPRPSRKAGRADEKAVVVKAISPKDRDLADPFAEVTALAQTAGVEVLRAIPQRLERPNGATYLGRGKVQEAARTASELDVDDISGTEWPVFGSVFFSSAFCSSPLPFPLGGAAASFLSGSSREVSMGFLSPPDSSPFPSPPAPACGDSVFFPGSSREVSS